MAAAFAIGSLTGAAGIIVVRDVTTPSSDFASVMPDHMDGQGVASMMSNPRMSGSMMGPGSSFVPGSSFGPGMMNGPAASSMPGRLHDQHHPAATPDSAK
jgi:hypothetical protein